jgi:hypothetical protein
VGLRGLHRPPLGASLRGAILGAAVGVPLALALIAPAHVSHPASLGGGGDELIRRAVACLVFGVACGAPVLAGAWFVGRSTLGSAPLAVAAGAGVAGALALQLHCPITAPPHLLLGHATVVPLVLGVALGVRWVAEGIAARGSAEPPVVN